MRWVAAGLFFMIAVIVCRQLFVPPIVGLADNGDYFRLWNTFGISSEVPHEERFFAYLIRVWNIDARSARDSGFISSDLPLMRASLAVNRVLAAPGKYDIRSLGAVRAALFLLAAGLLLHAAATSRVMLGFAALALAFVFCDVGYLAYFNSGFSEASSFVFGLLSIAFFVRLSVREPPSPLDLVGVTLSIALLVWSKPQNLLIAVPLTLIVARLGALRSAAAWRYGCAACAALVAACATLQWHFKPPAYYQDAIRYIAVFNAILPASPDVAGDLRDLGLPQELQRLAGHYPWSPLALAANDELQRAFYPVVGYRSIARFHLAHPDRAWLLLRRGASNALQLRPVLGNFEFSPGMPRAAQARDNAWRSDFVRDHGPKMLKTLLGIALLAMFAAIVFWRAARSVRERLLAEGVIVLLVVAALQYATVAILQGHDLGAKGMAVFAFFFDAAIVASVALMLELVRRAAQRRATPP